MIETVPEILSTNASLVARLAGGEAASEGHWLIADRQVAGRGRAGRVWSDGLGNFMGSTVVALRASDPIAQTLALVAGVAVHDAVIAVAPGLNGLMLKWPNDLLVKGAKLAGILLERRGDAVVVGIGVNLAQAPQVPDRPTACLAGLGFDTSRDVFATVLAERWRAALARWHLGEWPVLREQWLAYAHPAGTLVMVRDNDHGPITGAFGGIAADGVALLRLADGSTRAIHAGDIEMVG